LATLFWHTINGNNLAGASGSGEKIIAAQLQFKKLAIP
jgi:hypothetical protein